MVLCTFWCCTQFLKTHSMAHDRVSRFEDLFTVVIKITVFWDEMTCSSADPKYLYLIIKLHCVTFQKAVIFMFTTAESHTLSVHIDYRTIRQMEH
jgi:hypothetical protein